MDWPAPNQPGVVPSLSYFLYYQGRFFDINRRGGKSQLLGQISVPCIVRRLISNVVGAFGLIII